MVSPGSSPRSAASSYATPNPVKPSLVTIFEAVSDASGLPISAIRGRRRTRGVIWSRFIVIALVKRRFPWWSQSELAKVVGRLDHGTASHALQRADELAATDPAFADLLSRASELVRSQLSVVRDP